MEREMEEDVVLLSRLICPEAKDDELIVLKRTLLSYCARPLASVMPAFYAVTPDCVLTLPITGQGVKLSSSVYITAGHVDADALGAPVQKMFLGASAPDFSFVFFNTQGVGAHTTAISSLRSITAFSVLGRGTGVSVLSDPDRVLVQIKRYDGRWERGDSGTTVVGDGEVLSFLVIARLRKDHSLALALSLPLALSGLRQLVDIKERWKKVFSIGRDFYRGVETLDEARRFLHDYSAERRNYPESEWEVISLPTLEVDAVIGEGVWEYYSHKRKIEAKQGELSHEITGLLVNLKDTPWEYRWCFEEAGLVGVCSRAENKICNMLFCNNGEWYKVNDAKVEDRVDTMARARIKARGPYERVLSPEGKRDYWVLIENRQSKHTDRWPPKPGEQARGTQFTEITKYEAPNETTELIRWAFSQDFFDHLSRKFGQSEKNVKINVKEIKKGLLHSSDTAKYMVVVFEISYVKCELTSTYDEVIVCTHCYLDF